MHSDGTPKLRFGDEWEDLLTYTNLLQQEMQQRSDFIVLVCETVVGEVC